MISESEIFASIIAKYAPGFPYPRAFTHLLVFSVQRFLLLAQSAPQSVEVFIHDTREHGALAWKVATTLIMCGRDQRGEILWTDRPASAEGQGEE